MGFEFDGIDDAIDAINMIEMDCPDCNKLMAFKVSNLGSVVTCPHCKVKIKLEG